MKSTDDKLCKAFLSVKKEIIIVKIAPQLALNAVNSTILQYFK